MLLPEQRTVQLPAQVQRYGGCPRAPRFGRAPELRFDRIIDVNRENRGNRGNRENGENRGNGEKREKRENGGGFGQKYRKPPLFFKKHLKKTPEQADFLVFRNI